MQTIVLSGTGPHMKVRSGSDHSKVLVVGKTKTKVLNLSKNSNIKFAA